MPSRRASKAKRSLKSKSPIKEFNPTTSSLSLTTLPVEVLLHIIQYVLYDSSRDRSTLREKRFSNAEVVPRSGKRQAYLTFLHDKTPVLNGLQALGAVNHQFHQLCCPWLWRVSSHLTFYYPFNFQRGGKSMLIMILSSPVTETAFSHPIFNPGRLLDQAGSPQTRRLGKVFDHEPFIGMCYTTQTFNPSENCKVSLRQHGHLNLQSRQTSTHSPHRITSHRTSEAVGGERAQSDLVVS